MLVWGCFGGNKAGDIVNIEAIVKKKQHHNILQSTAVEQVVACALVTQRARVSIPGRDKFPG